MIRYISGNPKVRTVKVEKDVFVRDEYGVRRRAFVAGDEVPAWIYKTVLTKNTPVDPNDAIDAPEDSSDEASVVSEEAEAAPADAEAEDAAEKPADEEDSKSKGKGKK